MHLYKKTGLILLIIITLSSNSYSQDNMVNIKINKDAQEYISENNIEVLSIYVEVVPCGCARPTEVPKISVEIPEEIQDYHKQKVDSLTVYFSKQISIPKNSIEVMMQEEYDGETKLYPIGIEHFIKGVGNYCKFPTGENEL